MKTKNKSILGTMVDSIKMLEAVFAYDQPKLTSTRQRSLYLSEVPSLVMQAKYPMEAATRAFGSDNR